MNRTISKLTSSARDEIFNPLIYPFLLATLAYGVGFLLITLFGDTFGTTSLFASMTDIHTTLPVFWAIGCLVTIVLGVVFLLLDKPPLGRFSGLLGFSVWAFAAFCYLLTGNIVVFFAVTVPNLWFWMWQYLSLSAFNDQDREDRATMKAYDTGGYDDNNGGRSLRENNRGVDTQSKGSYDNPDDGGDFTRPTK